MLIQDYLDICDPVLTFDRFMGEIELEKYLKNIPQHYTGRLRYDPMAEKFYDGWTSSDPYHKKGIPHLWYPQTVDKVYFGKDSKKQFSWPFLNAKIFWISFCQKSQLGMILDTGCGLVSWFRCFAAHLSVNPRLTPVTSMSLHDWFWVSIAIIRKRDSDRMLPPSGSALCPYAGWILLPACESENPEWMQIVRSKDFL